MCAAKCKSPMSEEKKGMDACSVPECGGELRAPSKRRGLPKKLLDYTPDVLIQRMKKVPEVRGGDGCAREESGPCSNALAEKGKGNLRVLELREEVKV